MNKTYVCPVVEFHKVKHTNVIVTSDPSVNNNPADSSSPVLSPERNSDWNNYENR